MRNQHGASEPLDGHPEPDGQFQDEDRRSRGARKVGAVAMPEKLL